MAFAPFLRSPPFPWAAVAKAAVSAPGRCDIGDVEKVFGALRAARVGGEFWGDDDPWADRPSSSPEAPLVAAIAGRSCDRNARTAAIEALVSAQYRDPFNGAPIDILEAIAILGDWRRLFEANRAVVAAVGMAVWKRGAIEQFLWDGRASPTFASPRSALNCARPGEAIAYWPSRSPEYLRPDAEAAGIAAWQVEDGFIRSAGLGVECRPPMSILVDRTGGIHFDPTSPSELETILATHQFDAALIERAARLRKRIVASRLGKYGVDQGGLAPTLPVGRRIVLAVGQVADDLSVLRGGHDGMTGFLARVRAAEPDAFIVYRPHPDVATGLRRGELSGQGSADLVVSGGSLLSLVEHADAVHVFSSLTGFEALLRGVPVSVHGSPFYAGWGLTTDLVPQPPRRGRTLSLDELVAGALILAPRYRDPVTELPCPPEVLVERLAAMSRPASAPLVGLRKVVGATRRTLSLAERRA